jgi:hypothetical protein
MKHLLLLISAVLISSSGYAAPVDALATAWKSYHTLHPKQGNHDLEMVYGGEDLSAKRLITQQTASA